MPFVPSDAPAGVTTGQDDAATVGPQPRRDRRLLALVVALALTVVGEGVETEGQLTALVELGCDQAQGFLFSLPVDPEQLRVELEAGPGDT